MSTQVQSPALSREDHDRAWLALYRLNLEALPDIEVTWERDQWRKVNMATLVDVCDIVIDDRRETESPGSGGALPHELDRLQAAIAMKAVGRLVEHEAMTIVDACRLVFWAGLRSEQGR